jgi:hypothetical protein
MNLRLDITELRTVEMVKGLSVYYTTHRNGEPECGNISSWNDKYVFVKFDNQVNKLGWNETTAQACKISDLRHRGFDLSYPKK